MGLVFSCCSNSAFDALQVFGALAGVGVVGTYGQQHRGVKHDHVNGAAGEVVVAQGFEGGPIKAAQVEPLGGQGTVRRV